MMNVQHVMWCDLTDGDPPHAGECRGEPGPEIHLDSDRHCPFCFSKMTLVTGYTERVIITRLIGTPVEERQLVEIVDIPPDHLLYACSTCRIHFTETAS